MATFLLCWVGVSVVGTFIALTLINSGKRKSRAAEIEQQNAIREAQATASKSF